MSSGDSNNGVPWRQIAIGAGISLGVAGAAYLVYKHLLQDQEEDNQNISGHPDLDSTLGLSPQNHSESAAARRAPAGAEDTLSAGNKALAEEAQKIKNEGNELFKEGKYQEAIEKYTQALKILPEANVQSAATFYQNRAAAHEKLENRENVLSDCSSAIEKNRNYTKAYLRRAKANEELNRYKDALTDFTAGCVLEQFSNHRSLECADRVLKTYSEIQAKQELNSRPPGFCVPLSKTFVDSYFSSFCEDPVLHLVPAAADVINGHTDDVTGFDLVLRFLGQKLYDEAVDVCTEVINAQGEKLAEALLVRATFGLIRGKTSEATKDFEYFFQEVEKIPDEDKKRKLKANALIKRGSFHMQQGRKNECLADFVLAEQIDPENADVYHHRGQLEILMNDVEKAKEDFDRCIKLRPDFAVARVQSCFADYRHGMATMSTLEANNAITNFERVLRDEFTNCAEGYALLGQVYAERQAYNEAEEMFDKALEISPDNANIWVHKGLLELQRSEDFKKSRELMKKALDVDPNSEFAYETLGTLEVQSGDVSEALEHFKKAIDLARTELELIHLFSMKEAALSQKTTLEMLGVDLPSI